MIRLRVDWHSQCPGCGTQLAVDFLESSSDYAICPWCGHRYEIDRGRSQEELKTYVKKAVKEIEDRVNTKTPA